MTVPPADSNAASTANLNCEYIPHPDGIHEMVIYTSKVETIDEMLAKFNIMYATTKTQDKQLVLIHDLTKTGLPLTPLFSRLRTWLREHPLHPNPRVAVLFGHNNLLGMLGSFLGSMGIAPRRVTMWKPSQREQAEAWLLSDPK